VSFGVAVEHGVGAAANVVDVVDLPAGVVHEIDWCGHHEDVVALAPGVIALVPGFGRFLVIASCQVHLRFAISSESCCTWAGSASRARAT